MAGDSPVYPVADATARAALDLEPGGDDIRPGQLVEQVDTGNLYVCHGADGARALREVAADTGGGGGGTVVVDFQNVTGGDVSVTSTTSPGQQVGSDLVVAAAAGDTIAVGVAYRIAAIGVNTEARWDAASRVSAADVNYWSSGSGTEAAGGIQGLNWDDNQGIDGHQSGEALMTVASGDLSGGNCTIRVYVYKSSATTTTLDADAARPLRIWAKNFGQ